VFPGLGGGWGINEESEIMPRMKSIYEVTSLITGKKVRVAAASDFSAVAKAHRELTGQRVSGSKVTWHGTHCEVDGKGRYAKPVQLF